MSSQYIPFNVHSDIHVPSDVTGQAISKVWSFLNRKKAYLAEMSQKDRKTYLKKQARLFNNLREEHRPSLEDGQHYVSYNESLPFGNGHLTLQDAFRRLANESDVRDQETGTLLDAAIVTSITERVRAVLHDKKVRDRTNISSEVAPLTSDKNPHRWNPAALYFTRLEKLEAAQSLFAKSSAEEVDRWTTVQVADISLGDEEDLAARLTEKMAKQEAKSAADAERAAATQAKANAKAQADVAKEEARVAKTAEKARLAVLKADAKKAVAMMTAKEAIAKAAETQALLEANKELSLPLIPSTTMPPVTPEMKEAINRARKEQGLLEAEYSKPATENGVSA